jgi:hypothetical protein
MVGVKQGGPESNSLIITLDESGKTYDFGGLKKGTMVYADDTTLVCDNINNLKACIQIIEVYCKLYDIQINAKKTKCMIFGEIRSIVEPEIKVNDQIIEIVNTFKFLGVHIDREGNFVNHLNIKRTAFFSGITEVERLGIHKQDVPSKMKGLLYTALVRSKLTYGLEGIKMSEERTRKELTSLESNTLKRLCDVNRRSKSTALIYALNITPIKLYLYKRKLYFILQLLSNVSTNELVSTGVHTTLDDILQSIGVKKEHIQLGKDRYRGIIKSLVIKKLEDIKLGENAIKASNLVTSLEFLLNHRSPENNDTLQYLLDPRRCMRG